MSWETLPPWERDAAERVSTAKELEALKLKSLGYGRRRIASVLGISDSAVRDRLRSARRKIEAELNERGL